MASGLLAGRLALVTGAGSGIGRAVCQAFAREGARLAAVDVHEKGLAPVLSLPGDNKAFTVDISQSVDAVTTLFNDVNKAFSQIPCCVVNCAGITRDSLLLKMDEKDFDQVLQVNLKGTFLITQVAGRFMIQNRIQNGSIVNISSIVAKVGNLGQCNYAASKAGVIGLTKSAAKELAKFGIRCNAIMPGFIDTPMVESIPDKVIDMLIKTIPLGRIGKPSEIADACLFLASDKSLYITGSVIEVTGGMFM